MHTFLSLNVMRAIVGRKKCMPKFFSSLKKRLMVTKSLNRTTSAIPRSKFEMFRLSNLVRGVWGHTNRLTDKWKIVVRLLLLQVMTFKHRRRANTAIPENTAMIPPLLNTITQGGGGGGGFTLNIFKPSKSQQSALATHTPILGRVAQGAWE